MNKLYYFLLLPLFVFVGALLGAPQANAASDYDQSMIITDTLEVSNTETIVSVVYGDITDILRENCNPGTDIDFESARVSGSVSITQMLTSVPASSGSLNRIFIQYNPDQTNLSWQTYGVETTGVNNQVIAIYLNSSNDLGCEQYQGTSLVSTNPNNGWDETYYLFYSTYNPNYPTDYEGEPIPDNPPDQGETSNRVPPLLTAIIQPYVVRVFDPDFINMNNVRWYCPGGDPPLINYELYNRSDGLEVPMDNGSFRASTDLVIEFPRVTSSDQDYRIVAWYSCPDDPITFTEVNFIDFSISQVGMINEPLFEDCIVDGFPYVNLPNCVDNMSRIVNVLVFNIKPFPDFASVAYNQCVSLSTLDTWLMLPEDFQACPQFSTTIRNIVTPFIAFLLGLVTLGFLNNRNTGSHEK